MRTLMGIGLMAASSIMATATIAAELETEDQKLSYIIGFDVGSSLRQQGTDIDLEVLMEAISTAFEGGTSVLTTQEVEEVRNSYVAKRQQAAAAEQEAAGAKNLAEGAAFLAENANAEGVQVTASGLQYKVVTMGDGPMPLATDTVKVDYRGTLLDGTEFDSSYSRGEPISFGLNRVIAGWTEGLQLMPVGSKFMFYIKPELGYGAGGGGPIPPNSTLVFQIELLGIE